MSMVSELNRLCSYVDAGYLTRDEAVHRLLQYADGGLTRLGAEDLIDHGPRTTGQIAALLRHLSDCPLCGERLGRGGPP